MAQHLELADGTADPAAHTQVLRLLTYDRELDRAARDLAEG